MAPPVLAGLTDSVERGRYHLQSFLLHANRALLAHPAWLRFWLDYAIEGSKDDLINQGEIGLSQAMLAAGVELNQSLFAWRSLLGRGFPFVKKHVLFQLAEHQGRPLAISELASLLPSERCDLLAHDIEQLLISRNSDGTPPMC